MSELINAEEISAGSLWRRWEPHVHAPGTIFNNQFKGADAWDRYLTALEQASPEIEAIAVTDYYCTDTYRRVVEEKTNGRLPRIELIFPNIEMRLDVATVKDRWANVHLLISPEDPDHLVEIERFLGRLRFEAHGDKFSCTRADLTALGRKADPRLTDDGTAFRHGASQFKVGFSQLRDEFAKSDWAKANILVAIAGSETDGTSGIHEAADATLRQEIERFAHIIFASSSAQREFWLGRRSGMTEAQLRERYNGCKPCLHGSDAHDHHAVAAPAGDRFSWVKGDLHFDTLRQACIDPAGRAFVGASPPSAAMPSQIISHVEVSGATWAKTPRIPLNPGLVAVIGARGSGKTALMDMIAAGCDALPRRSARAADGPSASFIERAAELLGDAQVEVAWQTGGLETRRLDGSEYDGWSPPRVRYLSQQFVEELCSSSGVTDALLREIERVIFESHPPLERDGAVDFAELLEMRSARFHQAREREQLALLQLSERISAELEKDRQVASIEASIKQRTTLVAGYTTDRAKLVTPGSEARVAKLTALTAASEKVRSYLRLYANQEQALLALRDEVADLRQNQAPETLRRSRERHAATKMKDADWSAFLIDYTGDVDAQLTQHLTACRGNAQKWKGVSPAPPVDASAAYIVDDADLSVLPLALLNAEIDRLQKLVSADTETQRQFQALSKRIVEENTTIDGLKDRLTDAQGAKARARELLEERGAAYVRVFEALISEQKVLEDLYRPLMERLASSPGTLRKLSFTVARVADVAQWANVAESELVDLRRQGSFRGRGTLQPFAEELLKAAWETGDANTAGEAMAEFRNRYQDELLDHATVSKTNPVDFRAWSKRFAQWLYSTDHIEIRYGINYDGIEIRKLSPGTRGIVLLLLYLALDDADDRPLIIDQPEENLDPKSVFDELVSLFIAAKSKRQVIMVTHNANLVINTDADQIIVAEAGPHRRGELPDITYAAGGLEVAPIRKAVCDILEGGEDAFKERARRLRVRLER